MALKTVSDYIDQAYVDCYVNNKQIDKNTTGLILFNRAIHDFERKLVQYVKTNFFVNKIQANLVNGTFKYNMPTGSSDGSVNPGVEQFRNILQVWVKYAETDGEYRLAQPISPTLNRDHPDRLGGKQSNLNPVFEFVENEVRIYPTPTENVTNGLQLDFQIMKKDYILTDNEATMPFPWQDHTPVLHRLRMYIFNARGKYEEKAQAEADFEKAFKDVTIAMSDVYCSPVIDSLPNLYYLTH